MHMAPHRHEPTDPRSPWCLIRLLLALCAAALLLLALSGPPRLPSGLPDVDALRRIADGSRPLPLGAVADALALGAWALCGWFFLTGLLQLALAGLDALTRGAAWVLGLRRLLDGVTPALVRRVAPRAVAVIAVARLATSSISAAAAAGPQAAHVLVADRQDPDMSHRPSYRNLGQREERLREYTVADEDAALGTISEDVYGTDEHWELILDANRGRAMPDGRRFDGRVEVGDVLRIPPAPRRGERVARLRTYEVRDGDIPRGIAERFLGDEMRWPEIWELNKGKAEDPYGRKWTHEDLIYPGMVLELPPRESATPARNGQQTRVERVENAPRGNQTERGAPGARRQAPGAERPQRQQRPWEQPATPRADGAAKPSGDERGADTEAGGPKARSTRRPKVAVWGAGLGAVAARSSGEAVRAAPTSPTPTTVSGEGAAQRSPERPPEQAPAPTPTHPAPVPAPVQPTAGAPALAAEPQSRPPARDARPASPGLAGAAAAAAGAGGLLAGARAWGRRRARRARAGELREDGYVQPESPRRLAQRLHDGEFEPAVRVARHVAALLTRHGLGAVPVLTARESAEGVQLTLRAGLAEASRVLELEDQCAEALDADVHVYETRDGDVALKVGSVEHIPEPPPSMELPYSPMLVALGKLAPGHTLYANWRALSNVLLAGDVPGGVDVLLSSLTCALVSRYSPAELRLRVITSRRRWPTELADLPHLDRVRTDSRGEDALTVREAVEMVHAELTARLNVPPEELGELPQLVLVIGELAEVNADPVKLDTIALSGPERGVRLLAATTRVSDVPRRLLPYFDVRLALRLENEDDSAELLDSDQAVQLSGGADMLLRIGGRATVRLRAHKVEPEQLAQIAQLMRDTYGGGTGAPIPEAGEEASPNAQEMYDRGADTPPRAIATGATRLGLKDDEDERGADAGTAAPESRERAPSVDDAGEGERQRVGASADVLPGGSGPAAAGAEPDAEQSVVEMYLLGPSSVRHGRRALSCETRLNGSNKALHKQWELLHYVAAHGPEGVAVSRVAAAVWPGKSEDEVIGGTLRPAASLLRTLLRSQVEGLDGPILRLERGLCRFDPARFRVDTHRFLMLSRVEGAGRQAALEEAVRLYRGDLLADTNWSWRYEPATDESTSLHDRYQLLFLELANELAELYLAQGRAMDAIPVYKRMLDLYPPREEILLKLIECRRRTGQRRELERDGLELIEKIKHLQFDPDDPEFDPEDCDLEPFIRVEWEKALAAMGIPRTREP
jgi:DNA-binding SARP family transcriptional activator